MEITTTANQDPLLSLIPVIGVDIWEHAFYLQYKNVKVDVSYYFIVDSTGADFWSTRQYLAAIWNVINFEEAEKRLVDGKSGIDYGQEFSKL